MKGLDLKNPHFAQIGGEAVIERLVEAFYDRMNRLPQAAAIRAHAFEKFYATLTPDQKTKADSMHQFFKSHRRPAQSNS